MNPAGGCVQHVFFAPDPFFPSSQGQWFVTTCYRVDFEPQTPILKILVLVYFKGRNYAQHCSSCLASHMSPLPDDKYLCANKFLGLLQWINKHWSGTTSSAWNQWIGLIWDMLTNLCSIHFLLLLPSVKRIPVSLGSFTFLIIILTFKQVRVLLNLSLHLWSSQLIT